MEEGETRNEEEVTRNDERFMLKKLKKFTRNMIAGANVATIVLMLLIGYSDRLDPMEFPRLTNIGLAFPLFLLINVGFLAFWLLFKKRFALIPIAGFLIGYNPIRTYCPLNLPKTGSDSTLKVLSYNVYFAHERVKDGTKERVLDFLRQENADIVCLQEIYFKKDDYPTLHAMYPYVSSEYGSGGTDYITTLSRYPIIKREDVPLEKKKGRHSTTVFLDIDGDTVIIVNNHLASTMLTIDDRENFNKIVKGASESPKNWSMAPSDACHKSMHSSISSTKTKGKASSSAATSTTDPFPTADTPSHSTLPTATARQATAPASVTTTTISTSASTTFSVPTTGNRKVVKSCRKSSIQTIIPSFRG